MVDANTCDFICDNNLSDLVTKLINKNIISLWITQVQKDQLDTIPDSKKQKKQCVQELKLNFTPTAIVSLSEPEQEKGGYKAPMVGQVLAASDEDDKIFNELLSTKKNQSQRIRGDLGIVFTAFKKDIAFLVSEDSDIKQFYNELKKKTNTKLQLLNNSDFALLLTNLSTHES